MIQPLAGYHGACLIPFDGNSILRAIQIGESKAQLMIRNAP